MLIAIRSNSVFSVSDHLHISCSQENEGKREKYNIKSAEHTFKHMDGDFRVSCGQRLR